MLSFGEIYSKQLFKTVFFIVLVVSSVAGQISIVKNVVGDGFFATAVGVAWGIILVSVYSWFLAKLEEEKNSYKAAYENLKLIKTDSHKPAEAPLSGISRIEVQHTMEKPYS